MKNQIIKNSQLNLREELTKQIKVSIANEGRDSLLKQIKQTIPDYKY